MYLVHTPDMDQAEKAGGQFGGLGGKLVPSPPELSEDSKLEPSWSFQVEIGHFLWTILAYSLMDKRLSCQLPVKGKGTAAAAAAPVPRSMVSIYQLELAAVGALERRLHLVTLPWMPCPWCPLVYGWVPKFPTLHWQQFLPLVPHWPAWPQGQASALLSARCAARWAAVRLTCPR